MRKMGVGKKREECAFERRSSKSARRLGHFEKE